MARAANDTGISWPAISSAVALLTSLRGRSGDSQADLIGSQPEQVVTALVVISTVLLEALTPDAGGDLFLRQLGLRALRYCPARDASGAP